MNLINFFSKKIDLNKKEIKYLIKNLNFRLRLLNLIKKEEFKKKNSKFFFRFLIPLKIKTEKFSKGFLFFFKPQVLKIYNILFKPKVKTKLLILT